MHRVLVVEDDPAHQNALLVKLKHENMEPLVASDGEEGLKLALEKHPDLIMLDIIMPKLDGIEFIKKLREDRWGQNVPVIILTNLPSDSEKLDNIDTSHLSQVLVKAETSMSEVMSHVKDLLQSA